MVDENWNVEISPTPELLLSPMDYVLLKMKSASA